MINYLFNKDYKKKYYILRNNYSKKIVSLAINRRKYCFIVDNKYFEETCRDLFNIKEKLYILNHPFDVTWYKISSIYKIILSIFFTSITPYNLKLDVSNGVVKFTILTEERGVVNE